MGRENTPRKKVYIQRQPNGEVYAHIVDKNGNVASKKHLGLFTEDEYEALLDTINNDIAINLDS